MSSVDLRPGPRSNNLDGLRLVGALLVIFGHAYALMALPVPVPVVAGYPVQTLGLTLFFAISGYLIAASWNRTRNPVTYLVARSLRIFPALVVVVLTTVFVLGPWFTSLTRAEYFDDPRTWDYLGNIAMRLQHDLPGVFLDGPYPIAVNGSLWSLPVEFACYLLVPLLLLVPRRLRAIVLVAAALYCLQLAQVPVEEDIIIWGTPLNNAAPMWAFFAGGALMRVLHERYAGLFRADVAVLVTAAFLLVTATVPEWHADVAWVAVPYVVLTLGLASTPYLRRTARFGDVSYGLYLWAFPVQQVVSRTVAPESLAVNLVLVTAITGVLAFASWHLVEKPALALKDRLVRPRRGARRAVVAETTGGGPQASLV
ncbi:acyltransferase family protein [Nocardioides campestrisoli]|uniref:acyltransferase family protein n=1 Tax=Nocardioides campestrisoli TaxID=2736757 RepID=UPI00163D7EE5|nr:acyltransferase [Nocardioides campestrisoli]